MRTALDNEQVENPPPGRSGRILQAGHVPAFFSAVCRCRRADGKCGSGFTDVNELARSQSRRWRGTEVVRLASRSHIDESASVPRAKTKDSNAALSPLYSNTVVEHY